MPSKPTTGKSPLCVFVSVLLLWVLSVGGSNVFAGWQVVWSEEFDVPPLDTTKWTFDTGNGFWVADPGYWVPGWGNNELENYTSRTNNVYVTDGFLHIHAQRESLGSQSYTSGRIKTKGLFSKKYGRLEFRAKLPAGTGLWPALWMLPENSPYGGWPNSGEIDVMENNGATPDRVGGTIHYGGASGYDVYSGQTYYFPSGDSTTNFHIYALEWTTNSIRWLVDGVLYQTRTNWWSNVGTSSSRHPFPAPFDQPFYLLMNLAIGGNYLGNPSTNLINASLPAEMVVDYVRVYDPLFAPPPPPVIKLRLPFDDPPGSNTTASDTSGGGVHVSLQMINGAGGAADYHGTVNSGVSGALGGARAMDFSANTSQPGQPGPVAAMTSANLGFGIVSNFVVSFWMKQNSVMANGANIGPRLFVLGTGTPADTGTANSIGIKFQTASQLYFQVGGVTASASFSTNLPADTWLFIAATCDGDNVNVYQGTETASASLVTTTQAGAAIDFGNSSTLYVGNRQDRQRSFDGWIDDFRFYTGFGNQAFVESLRVVAVDPSASQIHSAMHPSGTELTLTWSTGQLLFASSLSGPWELVTGATSPFDVPISLPQQFFRVLPP